MSISNVAIIRKTDIWWKNRFFSFPEKKKLLHFFSSNGHCNNIFFFFVFLHSVWKFWQMAIFWRSAWSKCNWMVWRLMFKIYLNVHRPFAYENLWQPIFCESEPHLILMGVSNISAPSVGWYILITFCAIPKPITLSPISFSHFECLAVYSRP